MHNNRVKSHHLYPSDSLPLDGLAEALLSLDDRHVLESFGVDDVIRSVSPPTGTVNRTVLLETAEGSLVLRCSSRERSRVEWEHIAIGWAADHGVPVCRPISLSNGKTILDRDGKFYGLFPFAPGRQIARLSLQKQHARVAGEYLARIHSAFSAFPVKQAPRKKLAADVGAALHMISVIEKAILKLPLQTGTERATLNQLLARRDWLQQCDINPNELQEQMARLPHTILHGDYQETNLFFDGEAVVAVIDWDQSGFGPRAYDVLRALHLMLGLNPELCRVFLEGYRGVQELPDEELEIMARCYGVLSDSNLWVFTASYLEGNERAKQFIVESPFIPFGERWKFT